MSFAYLASPYSHPDPLVIEERYFAVCRAAARLMQKGERVFSPIAHSHPIAEHGNLDALSHDFWLKQDFALLRCAGRMLVLMLDGWRESKGIRAEIDFATLHGIPVEYVAP